MIRIHLQFRLGEAQHPVEAQVLKPEMMMTKTSEDEATGPDEEAQTCRRENVEPGEKLETIQKILRTGLDLT